MSSEFGAFIFSFLDDYGLDPYEFRLYARIQRRAGGQGKCYESLESMAKGCLMNIKTARRALQSLVKFNMVGRQDVPGSPTRFWLNPQQEWKNGPTPTKSGGGVDSECDNKKGAVDGPTPTKLGRATKSGRGMNGPTPTKNDLPPLPKTTYEGIPSKVKKEINQETPCIPLLEPAAVAPDEETHGRGRKGQEEEKAQEEDSSQSSFALAESSEVATRESERSSPGQIVPAAGAAVEKVRERKYDAALGMRPARARVKYRYPEGPWLTANGCINEDFLEWEARDWMTGPAFGHKTLEKVKGNVASCWQKPDTGAATLEIRWTAYVQEKQRYVQNVKTRIDGGVQIGEFEQRVVVAALPAITAPPIESYAESPLTPALLGQEATQIAPAIECIPQSSQRALEGKIEAPISATPIVTMSGVENGNAYQVFKADEKSVQQFAQVCQGPAQRVEKSTEDRPPTEEELAANVKRVAQMMAKLTSKKSIKPAEPQKSEFDRLQTLVNFARRDPMTIMQVREAEWNDKIIVEWNEEAEPPYPISIKPTPLPF